MPASGWSGLPLLERATGSRRADYARVLRCDVSLQTVRDQEGTRSGFREVSGFK